MEHPHEVPAASPVDDLADDIPRITGLRPFHATFDRGLDSGRLPLIVWTRPTKVGERIHLLCRAGICAEDFEAHIGELRAACGARDARVTRNRRWSQLVTIDVIRRDTLAASQSVSSPLERLTAIYHLDSPAKESAPVS
jgi:hypothetical protein